MSKKSSPHGKRTQKQERELKKKKIQNRQGKVSMQKRKKSQKKIHSGSKTIIVKRIRTSSKKTSRKPSKSTAKRRKLRQAKSSKTKAKQLGRPKSFRLRPTIGSRAAASIAAEELRSEAKHRDQYQKFLKVRRQPGKQYYGKIIFYTLDGKISKKEGFEEKRKGYAYYVSRSGKRLYLVREFKEREQDFDGKPGTPSAKRFKSIDFSASRFRQAFKAVRRARKQRFLPGANFLLRRRLEPTKREKSSIDFRRYADLVAKQLHSAQYATQSRKSFTVRTLVLTETDKDPIGFEVDFGQGELQELPLRDYKSFSYSKLYAFFAESLKNAGLVSIGSAQYIFRLPENAKQRGGFGINDVVIENGNKFVMIG